MERQEEKGSHWNRGSRRERMESALPRWQEVAFASGRLPTLERGR